MSDATDPALFEGKRYRPPHDEPLPPALGAAQRLIRGTETTRVTLEISRIARDTLGPGWRAIIEVSWKGPDVIGRRVAAHANGRVDTVVVIKALAASYIAPPAEIVWPDPATGEQSA